MVPTPRRFPSPRFGDYSRTRFESRVAFGGPDEGEDADEFVTTETRQFSLLEITSGLPDDSREADERAAERRLRDLRGRVQAARGAVATTPGLADALARDWQKAASFYVRFGITEARFRLGVPSEDGVNVDVTESHRPVAEAAVEVHARGSATLPGSGSSVYGPASSR